ncbi:hypothetical protein SJAG_04420 [Schizosaccharomyces japonicus yFS275]|uniref:Uncharacterized protein n=1 Tax=Schizosaccharomyces japonicus (strain yFS275 / FY16936) TaxID=402676 RepID=B6K6T1_SCHJY|nr:hypothetical protein SJAG_04420 [Schizosaccharomyces japonicus yFS275]EEB09235.1 hypothetical protein SJAG_04420 [Schizosaccharomyces japonicus yFS275]
MIEKLSERQLTNLREFLDNEFSTISQRYQKKFQPDGFQTLNDLIDASKSYIEVISGIPLPRYTYLALNYLLKYLDFFVDAIVTFPASPKPMFSFLKQLDELFQQAVIRGNMSVTEGVRVKSLTESCRMVVLSKMERTGGYEKECTEVFEATLQELNI